MNPNNGVFHYTLPGGKYYFTFDDYDMLIVTNSKTGKPTKIHKSEPYAKAITQLVLRCTELEEVLFDVQEILGDVHEKRTL